VPPFKWYGFFLVFTKEVKIAAAEHNGGFKKWAKKRNQQPMRVSGCKNAPIRDERGQVCHSCGLINHWSAALNFVAAWQDSIT
jgi:hypothetical protein